jgi:UDP-N-acetylglucosamine--N-acetylmuramyl-(pentapeptide) pyrophosphoryl-undecaprenol N-acetylglucosamine transferase
MRIVLTGGGTGGHFYPLIAIAEEISAIAEKEKILGIKLYFVSDAPFDKQALFNAGITFVQVPAGKMRTYSSILSFIKNFFDMFSTGVGAIVGLLRVFAIYPDVIISKGGYAAFPAVFAARILRIPLIIHESDSAPGRLNMWSSKFADHIAVSYAEAGEQFPKDKVALTGQPIRKEIIEGNVEGGYDVFKFDPITPVIFIVGGSQGAQVVNETILRILPELLDSYQVIHQIGPKNMEDVTIRTNLILEKHTHKNRYRPYAYMNNVETKMAYGISKLVISRAGSTIFEIAAWGVPSIIIPIANHVGDHQRKNAFNYARTGACEVIEEPNLTPHLLLAEIHKILDSKEKSEKMHEAALAFATPKAAHAIARVAINIIVAHES